MFLLGAESRTRRSSVIEEGFVWLIVTEVSNPEPSGPQSGACGEAELCWEMVELSCSSHINQEEDERKGVKEQNTSFEAMSPMSYLLQLGSTLHFSPHPNYVISLHHQEINLFIRTKLS